MQNITIIFRGGQCGNYLGYNIGKYITKRFESLSTIVNPVNNEYFTSEIDIFKYKIVCSHLNLLDNKHIKDSFFPTTQIKDTVMQQNGFLSTKTLVNSDAKVIVIHNNSNIEYTEVLCGIKKQLLENKSDNIFIGYDFNSSIAKERKKKWEELYIETYARMSSNFKAEGYDVFNLEYRDLFIDEDDNRNKYIELCDFLNEDYSNEGYNHLVEYTNKNIALMEKHCLFDRKQLN